MFATPVGDLITINNKRRISSISGIVCSFCYYILAIIAAGFLIASLVGSDEYQSQSVGLTNLGAPASQTQIDTDNVIIAFKNSMADSYMLGAFVQGTGAQAV